MAILVSYCAGPIELQWISPVSPLNRPCWSRPGLAITIGTEVRSITDRLFDALRRGILHVEIGQRYALSDAAEAHRALEGRRTTGSTILLP